MRFLFALLMIPASAFAQDAAIPGLAAKLGQQLANRQLRSVAVLRFTNTQNYDSQLSAHLVDQLNRALVTQGQSIEVASRSQSDGFLRDMRLLDSPDISSKDLQTLASRLSVNALITGTFAVSDQAVALDVTIFDGMTAHIIGGESARLQRADLDPYLVLRKGPPPAPGLTIPSGTTLDVKLGEKVDAASSRNGKTVSGTLESDLVVNKVTVAKKGAEVKIQATSPDGMELHLAAASLALADHTVMLSSDPIVKPATSSHSKALGGMLGGIANGGTVGVPSNAPAQMKPGEESKNAVLSFHLNQDAR